MIILHGIYYMIVRLDKVTKGTKTWYEVSSWQEMEAPLWGSWRCFFKEYRTLFFAKRQYNKLINYKPLAREEENLMETKI